MSNHSAIAAARTAAGAVLPLRRLWQWLRLCASRRRERLDLSALDERLLRDIGLTRQAADAEARKWFWRA